MVGQNGASFLLRDCCSWILRLACLTYRRGTACYARPASLPTVARNDWHISRALMATESNQTCCWDIRPLPTAVRGIYFYLYLFVNL